MDEDASYQARLLSQKDVADDSAGHTGGDDGEMRDEEEDDEEMDFDAMDDRVTAACEGGYMMSL
jgi:hypothetical protein